MPMKLKGRVVDHRPPKNPGVSIKLETYNRLKAAADKQGISVPALLEKIIEISHALPEEWE